MIDAPHPDTHHRCPDCKELIRKDAATCRFCGARLVPQKITPPPKDKTMATVITVAIAIAVAAAINYAGSMLSSAPDAQVKSIDPGPDLAALEARQRADAAEEAAEQELLSISRGARSLRQSMHNPDRFTLTSAVSMGGGVACYEYRAENAFGALRQGRAVLHDSRLVASDRDGFDAAWKRHCAGQAGSDVTAFMR